MQKARSPVLRRLFCSFFYALGMKGERRVTWRWSTRGGRLPWSAPRSSRRVNRGAGTALASGDDNLHRPGACPPGSAPGRPGFIGVPFSAMVLMFSPLSTVPFFPPLVKQRRSALPAILVSFDFSMAPRKSSVLFSPRPVRKGFTRLLRPEFLPQPFAFTVNG